MGLRGQSDIVFIVRPGLLDRLGRVSGTPASIRQRGHGRARAREQCGQPFDARFQPVNHSGVKTFRVEHKFRRATAAIRRVVNNNFARLLPVSHQVVHHARTASKDSTCPFDKPNLAGLGVFLTENEIREEPAFCLGEWPSMSICSFISSLRRWERFLAVANPFPRSASLESFGDFFGGAELRSSTFLTFLPKSKKTVKYQALLNLIST